MKKTIIGLFDDQASAKRAIKALVDAGFPDDDVIIEANDAHPEDAAGADWSALEGAARGAGTGAIVGGVAGLFMSLAALANNDIGPILITGPFAAVLTGGGVGALAGGLIGSLAKRGVSDENARCFAESIRQGDTSITVRTSEGRTDYFASILSRCGAVIINQLGGEAQGLGRVGYPGETGSDPVLNSASSPSADAANPKTMGNGEFKLSPVDETYPEGKRLVRKGELCFYVPLSEELAEHPRAFTGVKVERLRSDSNKDFHGANGQA